MFSTLALVILAAAGDDGWSARIDGAPVRDLESYSLDAIERALLSRVARDVGVTVPAKPTSSALGRLYDVSAESALAPEHAEVRERFGDWSQGALIEQVCFPKVSADAPASNEGEVKTSISRAEQALALSKKLGAPRVVWPLDVEAKATLELVRADDLADFSTLAPGTLPGVYLVRQYNLVACTRTVIAVCREGAEARSCQSLAVAKRWRGLDVTPVQAELRRARFVWGSSRVTASPRVTTAMGEMLARAEKEAARPTDTLYALDVRPLRAFVVGIEGEARPDEALLARRVTLGEAVRLMEDWAFDVVVKRSGLMPVWEKKRAALEKAKRPRWAFDRARGRLFAFELPAGASPTAAAELDVDVFVAESLAKLDRARPLEVVRRTCIVEADGSISVAAAKARDELVLRVLAQGEAAPEGKRLAAIREAAENVGIDWWVDIGRKEPWHGSKACVVDPLVTCPSLAECTADQRQLMHREIVHSVTRVEPHHWLEDEGVVMAGHTQGPTIVGGGKMLRGELDDVVLARLGARTIAVRDVRPKERPRARIDGEWLMRDLLKAAVEQVANAEVAERLGKADVQRLAEGEVGKVLDGASQDASLPKLQLAAWLETPVAADDPEVALDKELTASEAAAFTCRREVSFKLADVPAPKACSAKSLMPVLQRAAAEQRVKKLVACGAMPGSVFLSKCVDSASSEAAGWKNDEPEVQGRYAVVVVGEQKNITKTAALALTRKWAAADLRSRRAAEKVRTWQREALAKVVVDPAAGDWVRGVVAKLTR